jgi:hypothetical protein
VLPQERDLPSLQSLAEWHFLASKYQTAPNGAVPSLFAPAAALEDGLELLQRQSSRLSSPLLFEDALLDARAADSGDEGTSFPPSLHDLALEAKAVDPELFAPGRDPLSCGAATAAKRAEAVAEVRWHPASLGCGHASAATSTLLRRRGVGGPARSPTLCKRAPRSVAVPAPGSPVQVLYRRRRLRHEPFEWVYDGLQPLWLADVVRRRKGSPAALAVLAAAVGRRADVPLLPVPAAPQGGNTAAPGGHCASGWSWAACKA